jgi:hypothetical protein
MAHKINTFTQYKHEINRLVVATVGLSVDDLPDQPFMDWFADGKTVRSAAAKVIRSAKEF